MERKNPVDYNLLLWAGIAYVALRSSAVQGLLGVVAKPADLPSVGPDKFTIENAQRTQGPGFGQGFEVLVNLSHIGPGAAPYKVQVYADKASWVGRTVGWEGSGTFTFENDAQPKGYTPLIGMARMAPPQVNVSGVWDLTVQVKYVGGDKIIERTFPGAIVW